MGRYRIIDTDTHLIEPADTWTSRLPREWGNEILHVRWDDDERKECWFFGDDRVKPAWQWAAWGFEGTNKDFFDGSGPAVLSEAHPATYDVARRVEVMDELGIEMQVLYPNLAGFDWAPFVHHPNPDLSAAHISAYNDLQVEWVGEFPGRFIPMLVVPYWDLARTLAEIERNADVGFGGIVFTGAPHEHDQPALPSPHWYPMWSACEQAGLSVSFHTASGDLLSRGKSKPRLGEERAPGKAQKPGVVSFLENAKHAADLLTSGILPRFPTLQFVSVESGMGWVPFVLEALDKRFVKNGVSRTNPEFGDMLPSDYFHRQMWVNFWFEELTQHHLDTVGVDRLLWETDFPHPKGYAEQPIDENIEMILGSHSEDVRRTILWDNPARLYAKALERQGVDPLGGSAAELSRR